MNNVGISFFDPVLYGISFKLFFGFLSYILILRQVFLSRIESRINTIQKRNIIYGISLFVILFIGFRPLSTAFTDMQNYVDIFNDQMIYSLKETPWKNDFVFSISTYILTKYIGIQSVFFIIALIYTYGYCKFILFFFKKNPILTLSILMSLGFFFAYGVNTIRSGLASSLFLIAVVYLSKRKKFKSIILFFLSIGVHLSFIIPTIVFFISKISPKIKINIIFWFFSVLGSFFFGNILNQYIGNIDIGISRTEYFTTNPDSELFSFTGFRWDFIIYSAFPILIGMYAILKKRIESKVYNEFLSFYILTNAFWVWVIEANYSDRLAFLSWFIYPFLITFPLEFTPNRKENKFYLLCCIVIVTFSMII